VATVYPPELDRAIALAVTSGMRTGEILAGVRAGTLEGLVLPVPIPDRTFHSRLSRVREQLRQAHPEPEPQESFLAMLGRHYRDKGWSLERVCEQYGCPPGDPDQWIAEAYQVEESA
jgi:hypothetical protein